MKKLFAAILAVCMVLTMAACASGNSSSPAATTAAPAASADTTASAGDTNGDSVYRIGVYNYLSGLALGTEEDIAFQIALDRYNGKINGEDVEWVIYDTQNNPSEAVTGVQYLIGKGCDAVIGSFQSADVVAAYPYLEEAKIFNLMSGTSGSIVTPDQKYSFRGSFNANLTAKTYVELIQKLGYENVAIFYGQDEASVSNYEDIKPLMDAAGLNIVATETGSHQDTDYSAQCMKIVNANPDIVYVVCSGAGVNFVKQLREYGYNGFIMNKDEWMTSHVDVCGEEFSNYIIGVVPYTTYKSLDAAREAGASENVMDFLEKYAEKSGGAMPTLGITYRMYDAALIAFEAATKAGTNHDSDALVEACLQINDLQGCGGTIDFTQGDREPLHSFTPIIYCDGGSKTFEKWEADGGYDAYLQNTGRAK